MGCSSPSKTTSVQNIEAAERHNFFRAVGQNQLEEVKILLKQGIPAQQNNELGVTPLMLASFKGLPEMVDLLLKAGAKVDGKDDRRSQALHYAAQRGNTEVLNQLLQAGGSLEAKDNDGFTPLHLSVRFGSLESTELLLKKGSDANAKDKLGTPVSFFAVARGDLSFLKLLHKFGAKITEPDSDGVTPLMRSLEYQSKELFDYLLAEALRLKESERGPTHSKDGNSYYHWAAVTKESYFTEKLFAQRKNWPLSWDTQNASGETPAMWSARERDFERVKLLLQMGIDRDKKDQKGWDLREYLLSKDVSEDEADSLLSIKVQDINPLDQ